MKRLLVILYVMLLAVGSMHAGQVSETQARQMADRFFAQKSARFMAPSVSTSPRLAYAAERGRFYVYDRGECNGFVVVAGDDRLPQVLGYGDVGDFSASTLPPAVQYWMDEMNRQIGYLQAHSEVATHHPVKRADAVGPLLSTQWNQDTPYNNYCPTYGQGYRAMTGCVATATAQIMNYYQWPSVGRGSHSYTCNVNGTTPTVLSADFSQSVYRWDLMLDTYDENSSVESCDAVARLMSDVGIAENMDYGSSSGARLQDASLALQHYFGYSDKSYLLERDLYNAVEWDQFLVDEIGKNRPLLYCGEGNAAAHAFVLDGYDNDGYYHVNWGWGGRYDGFFLVSLLNPGNDDFKYSQAGLFGVVPETRADEIDDVLYMYGMLIPVFSSAPLGSQTTLEIDLNFQGNIIDPDTVEYYEAGNFTYYFDTIQVKLGVFDMNDVECYSQLLTVYYDLYFLTAGDYVPFDVPQSLEDGEYKLKLFYSTDGGVNYDHQVQPKYYKGKELYDRMLVADGTAYFIHRFLSGYYGVGSFVMPVGVKVNENFSVDVNLSYMPGWTPEYEIGPTGNIYLALMKDGVEVATGPMSMVSLPYSSSKTYQMQLTAPSEWGRYDLVLNDESGTHMLDRVEYSGSIIESDFMSIPVFILPPCQELVEDFETMTANNSTTDQNVQGRFTTWTFNKSGVRAPGEGKCNGINAVMMKRPSIFQTTKPLNKDFFMAQAVFFNPAAALSKYTLEYSTDGGATWQMAYTIGSIDVVEVDKKSKALVSWNLNLSASQSSLFRIAMIGGGNGATYVDDFALFYQSLEGDVNGDGEVNIADVNAVIRVILTDEANDAADVNGDGEVNIADVNTIIHHILE